MLSKFSVSNYKSFQDELEFDFKCGKFDFNQDAVSSKTNLVKTAIVYGKNGSGKSNLGLAIFDLVTHLTDKSKNEEQMTDIINLNSKSRLAIFCYEFNFKKHKVVYKYSKNSQAKLVNESLSIDNVTVLSIVRDGGQQFSINLKGAETLNRNIQSLSGAPNNNLSIINYVKNNSILDKRNSNNKIFYEFINFVEQMLYFRSLRESSYIGYETGSTKIAEDIIKNNKLGDFEAFLNEAGIDCKLVPHKTPTGVEIAFKFKNNEIREFFSMASTGTISLSVFYFWLIRMEKNNYPFFIFIDEFDAFYHSFLSALIIKKLKGMNKQIVCTTHNTDIMTNELLRPDCYYILSNGKINAITKCTEKEIREGHNLSKLYKAGTFNCD